MQTIQQPKLVRHQVRRYSRVRIPIPFTCSLSSRTPRWWFRKPVHDVGLVYDLSLHGLCVNTDAAIKPGDQISLKLRLNKGTPPAEVAVATVCWTSYPFHGLTFSALSPSSLQQLAEYIHVSDMEKE
ncbi:MAG: PilZ domain-containing protein [Nitrospira sp.]|nr:PilZ domain-containing protein [Nitrospira sp.]